MCGLIVRVRVVPRRTVVGDIERLFDNLLSQSQDRTTHNYVVTTYSNPELHERKRSKLMEKKTILHFPVNLFW